jgi:GTP-binding protein HflX
MAARAVGRSVPRPQALLLSLTAQNAEMEELLFSLGYDLAATVVQKRSRPDPALFLGPGKVEEVQEMLRLRNGTAGPGRGDAGETLQRAERSALVGPGDGQRVALVAVNAHLKRNQIAALERKFAVDVYDRVRVILEIFQQRAHTREAKLQVELARLRYERPLVREYVHLAKRGEHPGFMAGGAYAVDVYYDTINDRIARIKQELQRVEGERALRRKHRRRGGFQLVSLAGYSNAGKSSLLRRLSGEDVLVENRMFSTLETRTGKAQAQGRSLLVTDTVGFIDGLPPDLVQAFHSTLEEIAHADCIVLVCDGSDSPAEVRRKLGTSRDVLREFEDLAPLVLALNKADRVPAARRGEVQRAALETGIAPEHECCWISAKTGAGLEELERLVLRHVQPLLRARASLPLSRDAERVLDAMYREASVREVRRGQLVAVEFDAPEPVLGALRKRIESLGGVLETLDHHAP